MEKNYVVYHLHTDLSNADGFADSCTSYKDYIKLAKKQGMKAIAFSEHGNIYEWIKKKQECDKVGIKYIHGIEHYLCQNLSTNTRGTHIGLYAKNWEGVCELNKLITISASKGIKEDNSDRHMYYNKRISLDELMNTSDNIIVTSACLASPINKWNNDDDREFLKTLIKWMSQNKHRCFLEIQYHNCENQIKYNKMLYQISNKTGIPLIAGTDTHSSSKYKAECRKILQKYKDSYYGEEDEFDLTWKTYDELVKSFEIQNALPKDVYLQAIDNTNLLINMVEDFTLDNSLKYPTLYGDNVNKQWKQLIYDCFNNKLKNKELKLPSIVKEKCNKYFENHTNYDTDLEKSIYETYKKEYEWSISHTDNEIIEKYKSIIIEEFKVMSKLGMESFMMFMSELITWAKNNDIPCGTGRGSVCGCMIAFITNITDVDPIVWGTVFSRFCNEDRVSLGDIDVDFASEDREKVYQYIINRFTPEKTSYIISFSTIQDRGCIDVLAGGLGYKDYNKIMDIKNKFEDCYSIFVKTVQEEVNIEELIENGEIEETSINFDNYEVYDLHISNKEAKNKLKNAKKQYDILIQNNQDLFYYLDGLKGTIVAKGVHPSGIIGSPITLADNVGLIYKDGNCNIPISTCSMKAVDSLNYVKFDILGLKTVGIIKDVCKYANIPYPKSYALDWNDINVWDNMIQTKQGVFQFESDYAFSLLKDFKPSNINHMSMVNASLRPSGKSYRDKLIAGIKNENPSEEIDELLSSNNGYLIFQEDTIKFLTDICGFSGSEADTTRRCVDENSLILMGNGNYKKIKDIKIGDIVQSYNDYNISEPKKVTNVFNNGTQKIFTIKTTHCNNLKLTSNHKVLTQRGYIKVADMKDTDFLMTPKHINSTRDNVLPKKRLSKNTMYLIGLLIGDGSIGKESNISFTNHEEVLIDKFKECVNSLLRNKKECEFNISYQKGVDVDNIYTISAHSSNYKKSLRNLLDKFDLRHKASDKYIPDEFMLYPIGDKLTSLLAGLFNTDGGYNTKSSSIEYYSLSYILVYQIKSLLEKYNIYSYISTEFIEEYNYNCYTLIINQLDSLLGFEKHILPFIIGKKHNEYQEIINNDKNNPLSYNYLLPNECKNEIYNMSKIMNISLNSIGNKLGYKKKCFKVDNDSAITDTKARRIIEHLYCPYTYKLLHSDYIPIKIKEIKFSGYSNVYDIEVEDNHNYVANNLIVHNCIGKKDEEGLKKQLPKIIDGYCNNSNKNIETAKSEAKQFVQIIQDSSEYQFGLNHSTAYSMNGYECVWLRTYYPIEFIAGYLNRADNEDDIINGIILARSYDIKINPIKFGKSLSKYTISREDNSIYQGISSVKYCNSKIADELMELSKNKKYDNFIDLLYDLQEHTSLNSRQLTILIILNFFSYFGNNKCLLDITELFNEIGTSKILKKDKIVKLNIDEYLVKKYSNKETKTQYRELDNRELLYALSKNIKNNTLSIKEQVKYEMEYLEYTTYTNDKIDDSYYIVINYKTYKDVTRPYFTLRNIKTGIEIPTRITQSKIYKESPFGEYSILKIEPNGFVEKFKKKNINGKWRESDEIEKILDCYEVISK